MPDLLTMLCSLSTRIVSTSLLPVCEERAQFALRFAGLLLTKTFKREQNLPREQILTKVEHDLSEIMDRFLRRPNSVDFKVRVNEEIASLMDPTEHSRYCVQLMKKARESKLNLERKDELILDLLVVTLDKDMFHKLTRAKLLHVLAVDGELLNCHIC